MFLGIMPRILGMTFGENVAPKHGFISQVSGNSAQECELPLLKIVHAYQAVLLGEKVGTEKMKKI